MDFGINLRRKCAKKIENQKKKKKRLKGLPDVTQIQWYDCKQWSTTFAHDVIVRFARMESFWVFNLRFNSSMKRISKIKQSNLDRHFAKTGKSKKHFSIFSLQHELVCLKYYFLYLHNLSKKVILHFLRLHLLLVHPSFLLQQLDLKSWRSL